MKQSDKLFITVFIVHLLILAGGNEIPSNHYGVLRDA